MASRILLKNGTIISVDQAIGTRPHCDVLIENGVIVRVAENIPSNGDEEIIDATNCLVTPGFVDTHHHMWQQVLRSVGTDWSLNDYIVNMRMIFGSIFTPEDVYTSNYAAALDLINNGITTVVDHCHILNSPKHTDAAIKGLKDAGIRGTWCYGFYMNPIRDDIPGLDHEATCPRGFDDEARKADAKRVREQHFPPENDPATTLLTFGGAPSEVEGMSHADIRKEVQFFRSIGARVITAHVAQGLYDTRRAIVQNLGDHEFLGPDLLFSHGASFTEQEFSLMKSAGCGVSATAETELQMGMGPPVAFAARDAGCNVGLGIDVTCSNGNDMLMSMRLLLQSERCRHDLSAGTAPIKVARKSAEALEMATLGGARAIHLDHLVGSITPGKRADLVLTRCDDINVVPAIDAVGTLMFNAHPGNIDTVMVNGKILKKDGKLVGLDWPGLRAEIRKSSHRIIGLRHAAPVPSTDWRDLIAIAT